jgi:hypothetical protein
MAATRKSVRQIVYIKRAFFPTLSCRWKSPFSYFTKLLKEMANIPFFVPVSLSDKQPLSERQNGPPAAHVGKFTVARWQ